MLLKLIACEIAVREICQAAARSPNIIDFEFLTQGHHETPAAGRTDIQKHIDAVPERKYDAILLGYGLCSCILDGLTTGHTQLVIPRAHDCITLFLGSKERYQKCFSERPGTYYFTSGWLECAQRRGATGSGGSGAFAPAGPTLNPKDDYHAWVAKYGEDQAKYLLEEMKRWTANYSHATLIDFDFLRSLKLNERVRQISKEKGWQYTETPGDMRLFQRLLDGDWPATDFLIVRPGQKVAPSFNAEVIKAV
jgi:hypothetical protein